MRDGLEVRRSRLLILTANQVRRSLDYLIERMWDDLGLVKIYTKKRGAHPDLDDPVCLHKGSTIEVSSAFSSVSPACAHGSVDGL